jgi:hypothetical protein
MTTLVNMALRAQLALNDTEAGTWEQETLESWILDAVKDYSQYFPRVQTSALTVTSETGHAYDLPADFLNVILVEYPTGEDPPAYLLRRARTRPDFYDHPGYYDVEPSKAAFGYAQIYFSEEPQAGEEWQVTYHGTHDSTLDPSDVITVPQDHEYLLILFVIWQAFKERAASQVQDPDTTSDVLQKSVNAASLAEQEYRKAIKNAEAHKAEGGPTGPWRSDIYDPIY